MADTDPRRRLSAAEMAHEFYEQVAPDVYYFHGDFKKHHANQGWIVFDDYVLVIEASMPSGAEQLLRMVRETTDKPIRYVLVTHHHPDHNYGNQVWSDAGAHILAGTRIVEDIAAAEPALWRMVTPLYPELATARFRRPDVLVGDGTVFDAGRHPASNRTRVAQEEIFGPVLPVIPFADLDEAIALSNDTMFGLASGIQTRNYKKALRFAAEVKAGTVWVNTWHHYDPSAPFGGYKLSGYGREHGIESFDAYTQQKTVWLDMVETGSSAHALVGA